MSGSRLTPTVAVVMGPGDRAQAETAQNSVQQTCVKALGLSGPGGCVYVCMYSTLQFIKSPSIFNAGGEAELHSFIYLVKRYLSGQAWLSG